jgi:hypothetical protein
MFRTFAGVSVLVWLLAMMISNPWAGWHLFVLLAGVSWLTMEILRNRKTPVWLRLHPRRSRPGRASLRDTDPRE